MPSGSTEEGKTRRERRSLAVPKLAVFALAVLAGLSISSRTQDAIANGDTRSLSMVHAHTGESLTITYKRNGSFDSAALEKLNWFLRDWRVDEQITMAPQLFDVVWAVNREVGGDEPVKVMSAYRSPGTNAMLRRRSRAVAKESHHMRGNAMDIHIPNVSMAKAREIGMRLQAGGVGYYPSAGSPFVHLDVGSVRSWPRMSRDQLERLFPDGKTVHLPKDGVPLANYQVALAEIQARGGSALDYETVTTTRGPTLWALLFGSGTDEDAGEIASNGRRNAGRPRRGSAATEQVASLSNDNVMNPGIVTPVARPALPRQTAVEPIPSPEPQPAAAPALQKVSPPAQEKSEPVLQVASLPVPPIRPRGAQLEKLIAANDPLPPIRPASLGAFAALPPLPSVEPVVAAIPVAAPGMPVPPARPVLVAALAEPPAPQPVPAPLPPARPTPADTAAAPAPAALPAIVSRPEPAAPTALVQSYAAVSLPVPPSRPAAAAEPTPPPSRPASPQLPGFAPVPVANAASAIRRNPAATFPVRSRAEAALVAHSAAEARPAAIPSVAEPPVAREIDRSVVAMKFSTALQQPANGFSGTFVRPLGASFTRTGE